MRSRGRISRLDRVHLVADVPTDQVVAELSLQVVGQLVAVVPHALTGLKLIHEPDADLLGSAAADVQVAVSPRTFDIPGKRKSDEIVRGYGRLGFRVLLAELPHARDEIGLMSRRNNLCHGNGSL